MYVCFYMFVSAVYAVGSVECFSEFYDFEMIFCERLQEELNKKTKTKHNEVFCNTYRNVLYLNVDGNNVEKVIEASCFICK